MAIDQLNWLEVASLGDLKPDHPFEVVVDQTVVILVRVERNVIAYQGLCPHQFARLGRGKVVDGWLRCPHHRAGFCLKSGECGPGWALPALQRFDVRVEGDTILLPDPLVRFTTETGR